MNTNGTQALDAAEDEELNVAEMGTPPVVEGDEGAEWRGDSKEAEGRGAMTPLAEVTDWTELEERLRAAEARSDEAGLGAGELPPPAEARASGEDAKGGPRQWAKNYRLHTDDPQRAQFFQLLRQHPEANPLDLARMAGFAGDTEPEGENAETTKVEEGDDPLNSLREEIAELVQRKRAHREAYEFDKADELGERLLEARLELEQRTREVAEGKVTQAKYEAAYHDARGAAARLHPGTLQPGSRQFRLVRMLVAAKEMETPEFFEDPSYPLRLLGELERDFPETFPRRAGSVSGKVQGARSRIVGQAVAGNTGGRRAASRAELERAIESLGEEELLALANAVGTRPGGE